MIKAVDSSTNQRILIFAGGTLGSWALKEIREGDMLVGADRGALFLIRHGLRPHAAIGDFDSVNAQQLEEIKQFSDSFISCDPVMKDWSDTEMAFHWALEREPQQIVLLGVLGTRFDHSLANVHLLVKGIQLGVPVKIVDAHNEVVLVEKEATVEKGRFSHVSLLPLTPEVSGITLTGFQYPLDHATLSIGQSLGISNVLVSATGRIQVQAGWLLVIQAVD